MPINVDRDNAKRVIQELFQVQVKTENSDTNLIRSILNAEHKTYKYILINALLAKSTNEEINPLALQAGAPLSGAYDARSLCHKVVVPFERDFLNNALGGSNEPFLNKPARFTHLSKDNAVRRGADLKVLEDLITVLTNTTSAEVAKNYLCFALEILKIKSITPTTYVNHKDFAIDTSLIKIYNFIIAFIDKSHEGETCVIVVGALEKLYHRQANTGFKVIVHKVNQSGASSREVGDIDVYNEAQYKYSIEVKDKDFTEHDVAHAFSKITAANGDKGAFIYGPKANYDKDIIFQQLDTFISADFFVLFMSVLAYCRTILFHLKEIDFYTFINTVIEVMEEINCKPQTKKWLSEVLEPN
jgi:hypothetical protein